MDIKAVVNRVATLWLRRANKLYVPIQGLPSVLQRVLKEMRYNRRDVAVEAATHFRPNEGSGSFQGNRGYVAVVDLSSNRYEVLEGSWGGANPFEQRQVDLDDRPQAIPPNGAVVTGEYGGRGSFAHIKIHPSNLQALLPSSVELSDPEAKALEIIRSYKSSYRAQEFPREHLGRYTAENPLLQSLATKKLIKIDARGSIQITTEGKNALASHRK